MQLRKFIRLLLKAQSHVGGHAKVTIDTHRYKDFHGEWRFDIVDDVGTDNIQFVNDNDVIPDNAKEQSVIVLNPI